MSFIYDEMMDYFEFVADLFDECVKGINPSSLALYMHFYRIMDVVNCSLHKDSRIRPLERAKGFISRYEAIHNVKTFDFSSPVISEWPVDEFYDSSTVHPNTKALKIVRLPLLIANELAMSNATQQDLGVAEKLKRSSSDHKLNRLGETEIDNITKISKTPLKKQSSTDLKDSEANFIETLPRFTQIIQSMMTRSDETVTEIMSNIKQAQEANKRGDFTARLRHWNAIIKTKLLFYRHGEFEHTNMLAKLRQGILYICYPLQTNFSDTETENKKNEYVIHSRLAIKTIRELYAVPEVVGDPVEWSYFLRQEFANQLVLMFYGASEYANMENLESAYLKRCERSLDYSARFDACKRLISMMEDRQRQIKYLWHLINDVTRAKKAGLISNVIFSVDPLCKLKNKLRKCQESSQKAERTNHLERARLWKPLNMENRRRKVLAKALTAVSKSIPKENNWHTVGKLIGKLWESFGVNCTGKKYIDAYRLFREFSADQLCMIDEGLIAVLEYGDDFSVVVDHLYTKFAHAAARHGVSLELSLDLYMVARRVVLSRFPLSSSLEELRNIMDFFEFSKQLRGWEYEELIADVRATNLDGLNSEERDKIEQEMATLKQLSPQRGLKTELIFSKRSIIAQALKAYDMGDYLECLQQWAKVPNLKIPLRNEELPQLLDACSLTIDNFSDENCAQFSSLILVTLTAFLFEVDFSTVEEIRQLTSTIAVNEIAKNNFIDLHQKDITTLLFDAAHCACLKIDVIESDCVEYLGSFLLRITSPQLRCEKYNCLSENIHRHDIDGEVDHTLFRLQYLCYNIDFQPQLGLLPEVFEALEYEFFKDYELNQIMSRSERRIQATIVLKLEHENKVLDYCCSVLPLTMIRRVLHRRWDNDQVLVLIECNKRIQNTNISYMNRKEIERIIQEREDEQDRLSLIYYARTREVLSRFSESIDHPERIHILAEWIARLTSPSMRREEFHRLEAEVEVALEDKSPERKRVIRKQLEKWKFDLKSEVPSKNWDHKFVHNPASHCCLDYGDGALWVWSEIVEMKTPLTGLQQQCMAFACDPTRTKNKKNEWDFSDTALTIIEKYLASVDTYYDEILKHFFRVIVLNLAVLEAYSPALVEMRFHSCAACVRISLQSHYINIPVVCELMDLYTSQMTNEERLAYLLPVYFEISSFLQTFPEYNDEASKQAVQRLKKNVGLNKFSD